MLLQSTIRFAIALIFGMLLVVPQPASGQDAAKEACTGPYKGKTLPQVELKQVLDAHAKWLKEGEQGQRANLCGANLMDANLTKANLAKANLAKADLAGANLAKANLAKADLAGANLAKANLAEANLVKADLEGANLAKANLWRVKLREANLGGANLERAKLWRADLRGADLPKAILRQADLRGANLRQANLEKANLEAADLMKAILVRAELSDANLMRTNLEDASLARAILVKADFWEANLSRAVLEEANLQGATLVEANLQGADLEGANLQGAFLFEAFLRRANLSWANLRGSNLEGAELTGADLQHTDFGRKRETGASAADPKGAAVPGARLIGASLWGAVFEPKVGSLPDGENFAGVVGLGTLRYHESPQGLFELRRVLKKAGMDLERRAVTAALKLNENARLPWYSLKRWLIFLLLDFPCQFGWNAQRPLIFLFLLVGVFIPPYTWAVSPAGWRALVGFTHAPRADAAEPQVGIWRIWPEEALFPPEETTRRVTATGLRALLWGVYFSVLTAFRISMKDLNVSHWLMRIHPQEYALHATGWVRVVAGIQSLLCAYLFALWLVLYVASLVKELS